MRKALALIAAAAALGAAGCAQTSQAESEADQQCPSFSAFANGQCESGATEREAAHVEHVRQEAAEVEAALKRQRAQAAAEELSEGS